MLIGVSVFGLLTLGLVVGGFGVIDSRESGWWFAVQSPAGPVVPAADWLLQNRLKGLSAGELRLPKAGEAVVWEPDPHRPGARRRVIQPIGTLSGPSPRWQARRALAGGQDVGLLAAALAGIISAMALADLLTGGPLRERAGASEGQAGGTR